MAVRGLAGLKPPRGRARKDMLFKAVFFFFLIVIVGSLLAGMVSKK